MPLYSPLVFPQPLQLLRFAVRGIGLVALCMPLCVRAQESISVTVGNQTAENVLPINVPYVEAQLKRIDEIRLKLEALKEQQEQTLPRRIDELNKQIAELANRMGAKDDAELQRLQGEVSRLGGAIKDAGKALAESKSGGAKNYMEVIARDHQQADLAVLQQTLKQAERAVIKRLRELVSKDPGGARLAEEAWKADIDLAIAARERGNVQSQRDNISRAVRGMIGRFSPQAAPDQGGAESRIEIPPPRETAQRMARFRERNSPDQIRALGERFFAQIDLGHPGLEETARWVQQKNFQAALDAYKAFFFKRSLINFSSGALGLNVPENPVEEPEDAEDDEGGELGALMAGPPVAVRPPHPAAVATAMNGEITASLQLQKKQQTRVVANPGTPGAINWAFPDYTTTGLSEQERAAHVDLAQRISTPGGMGSVLLDSYVITGNREHLGRWTEIADDWSMNWPQDIDTSALMIRNYNMLIGYEHSNLVTRLLNSAKLNPRFVDDLPSATLARLLLTANAEYLTSAIRLMRSGQYNFRVMMLTGMIPYTLGMQEFHTIRWAAREATRLAELSMVHNIRRDGANATLANAGHENTDGSFISLLGVFKHIKPDWLAPFWSEEFTLNLKTYTRYWLHFLKQDGRAYRISTSPLNEHFTPGGSIKVQLLAGESEVQARMWKVFQQAFPYDDVETQRRLWTAFMQGEPGPEPAVRSETMPFSGYSFLRSGWEKSDYFFYFHCINGPVSSGRDDHNGFMLSGYLNAPPVFVDGRIQYTGYQMAPWSGGKAMFSAAARADEIKPTRFHSSIAFDLAEGLYDGAYILHPETRKAGFCDIFGSYGYDMVARRARSKASKEEAAFEDVPILDVKHNRQVLSVVGRDLYVVTDFLETPSARSFEQKYGIPTPVSNEQHAQRMELIGKDNFDAVKIDQKNHTIRVRNPGYSGLDMFHFGNVAINYGINESYKDFVRLKKQPANAPVSFRRTVTVAWNASGPSALTTVIAPYKAFYEKDPEPRLKNVKPIKGDDQSTGFKAEFADGTPIYHGASFKPSRLGAGGVFAQARGLLIVGNQGVALDCASLEVQGRLIKAPYPDFEFTLNGRELKDVKPIHHHIKPVTIEPESTVFAAQTEVKLACATPDVELRYTLDGSDVRHDSTLYTAPITISETTWVKARAFRKGLTETPWAEDGTHATVQSWAVLEKVELEPAVEVADAKPGLAYDYCENLWTVLMAEGPELPASKSGVVPTVLDVSPRQGSVTFGMRYSGFLEVPQDGVYTFHAPEEFQLPDKESGYDLRVYVNGKEWYPTSRWHAHGTWSVALKKGKHPFKVFYADLRRNPHREEMMWGFPKKGFVWQGTAPELKISGPGLPKQVVPASMLSFTQP